MFPSLAHLVVPQKGSRHNNKAEYESNLLERGKLDKIWIYCPNKLCKHHLSFKRSTSCLLLKCPICMICFNPYSPIVIQCKKCKTKNSTFLWNQIMQCANRNCKTIINCWPVFTVEKYKDFNQQQKKKKTQQQRDTINIDSDDDDHDDDEENHDEDDEDDDIKIIEKDIENIKKEALSKQQETFLMVKESEIGAYSNRKKKKNKLYSQEKIIRMENDNGLVVIINDNEQFKAKQHTIREPKVYKSPFEFYFTVNLEIWQTKYPNDNMISLLIKMKKFWKDKESEQQKNIYIKMSKDDKQRYEKELQAWKSIKWMNDIPYKRQDDDYDYDYHDNDQQQNDDQQQDNDF